MKKQTETEIRERVLKIFCQCRSKADAPFDESHFMDFLLYPPSKKDQFRNSFLGAYKHGNFMRKIELEFAICFTLSDYDSAFSLNAFCQKISQRIEKKSSNIALIKQRMNEKNYFIFEIAMLLILGALYYFLGLHWLPILLTPLFLIAIFWVFYHRIQEMSHTSKLQKKIFFLSDNE